MIIDFHVHTRHYSGCSAIEAHELAAQARSVPIDGLILTEHGILWRPEKLIPLQEQAAEHGILILAAQEVTCLDMGRRQDFLVFGPDKSLGTCASAKDLVKQVHAEGGLVIAAHPFKLSRLGVGYHGAGEDIYDLGIDAVELYHPSHDAKAQEMVRRAAQALNIPMTGGSDAHELYELGRYATQFFDRVSTMEDIMSAIRTKRIEPVTVNW